MWRTESHVLYVYYTDMHERVWIHTHTRIKIGWRKRRRICTTYPFVTYIRIPSPYTARLSRCLLGRTEIKSLELRPEGACNPTWYRCLNKTTMWKGTFSELGSAQRCHRLGYEKYNFSRKGSVFQVLMEKKSLNVQSCNTLFRGLSSPLFFKHRYPVGGQAPTPRPPPHTHTGNWGLYWDFWKNYHLCVETGWGAGGGGGAFRKKRQRNLGVRVHTFFFFPLLWWEREKDIDREK